MKHIELHLITLACLATILSSCEKNQYLPPDWNYDIPETPLVEQTQLGAFYNIFTTADWQSHHGYTPVLNQNFDESGALENTIPYTSTQDGILTAQFGYAEKAGIDFWVIPWNASADEKAFIEAYKYYRTENTKVKLVINYNLSHLKIADMLSGEGADFDNAIADFSQLYDNMFSQDWYYKMPDGKAIVILSGMTAENVNHESFIPALKNAMSDRQKFYFIGENTTNWAPPATNEKAAKFMDGNYIRKWYPASVYERWYCFYPFTDMAWQNWRDYCTRWGNDFVPCIYPEYYTNDTKARFIDRNVYNYIDFCNVAKRNIGSQNVILINSWNDFTTDSALEPSVEYGEIYLNLTKQQLKK